MPPHHPAPFGEVVDFPDRRKYHPTHRPIPIRDLDGPARHVTCPDKPTWLTELRDDFRDTLSEIKASPYSHALIAVLTVIAWTLLLVVPMMLGAGQ